MRRSVECPECRGYPSSEIVEGQVVRCWRCDGHGRVFVDFAPRPVDRFHLSLVELVMLLVAIAVIALVLVNRRPATSETPREGTVIEARAEVAGAAPALDGEVGVSTPAAVGLSPSPAPELSSAIESGIASFVNPGYGSRYLALPEGPGVRVTICGPAGCVVRTSTDAGPDLAMQRAGRIADLSFADFATVCGCDPRVKGTVRVTVERGGPDPRVTLPPTDLAP